MAHEEVSTFSTHNLTETSRDSSGTENEESMSNESNFYPTLYDQGSFVLPPRPIIYSPTTVSRGYNTATDQSLRTMRRANYQWSPFIRAPIAFVIFLCKRVILLDPVIKVCIYMAGVLFIPILGDHMPFYTRPYFAQRDNVFNIYFVKIGWLLTLVLSLPFVLLTSYTLCCGNIRKIALMHLPRLVIATFFWFAWTTVFSWIAKFYSRCSNAQYETRFVCEKLGYSWYTFDISGHTFILMHSSLVFIEETRPLLHWGCIEKHLNGDLNDADNPLRALTQKEIDMLRHIYPIATPILHTLFVIIACLQLLWDVMLLGTMLYHHTKSEKLISGFTAIITWFLTYRYWYHKTGLWPQTASSGCFCYNKGKPTQRPLTQQFDNVADVATNVATVVTEGVKESFQMTQEFISKMEQPIEIPQSSSPRLSWAQEYASQNIEEDVSENSPKPKTKKSDRFRRRISRDGLKSAKNDQQNVYEKEEKKKKPKKSRSSTSKESKREI